MTVPAPAPQSGEATVNAYRVTITRKLPLIVGRTENEATARSFAAPLPDDAVEAAVVAIADVIGPSGITLDCTPTAIATAVLAAAAPALRAQERERITPLLRALHRLYQVIWDETATFDGGPEGYNLVSYDDTNAIDEAAAVVAALLADGKFADLLEGDTDGN